MAPDMTRADDDNRLKQVAVGVGILGVLTVTACGALAGWRHLPGLLGEWVGMMVGVLTTPFFLEASLGIVGLTVVLAINHWRRKRAGEEWVDLGQAAQPEAPGSDGLTGPQATGLRAPGSAAVERGGVP